MAEIGSVIGGKYEIIEQIGRGGMSTVYLALDGRLHKQWAVKEVKKSGEEKAEGIVRNSLLVEADMMKRLDHPALPRIVDILEEEETICVVMDYIEGRSLDRILAERGALPEEIVLDWAKQICDVLLYLHSRTPPIIYRDMKPANVMLRPGGSLKIIDFGIAREYKEKEESDTTVLGTRGYASPEHYGSRQTDARSDIYTLGMTLHHLLTGVSPRTEGYVYRPLREWDPELSAGFEAVIDKCTALDPDARYQSCRALMYDLEHIDHLTKEHLGRQRRRVRLFFAALAICVLLFSAGFFLREQERCATNECYDTLVSVLTSLPLEEKLQSYEDAVRLRPDDATAYLCIVDAFEEEGVFDRTLSDWFLSLLNTYRGAFEKTDRAEELNYRIGTLYFNYYEDDGEDYSFSARVQKAYPFFAANHESADLSGGFADDGLSECYYQICAFYRAYVLSPVNGEEAVRENYLELIRTMDECIDLVLDVSAYDQLTLYSAAFLLLYDQRENMAAAGVEKENVLGLLDRVRARSVVLNVQKEQSAALQSEILDHYREYREAVVRAYTNAEEEIYG